MKIRLFTLLATLPLLLWRGHDVFGQSSPSSSPSLSESSKTVRVGVYQNEPKIFLDHHGKPAGFWVDILNTIAEREQWRLVYVPCEWQACLRSLQEGDLDLMPDVAYAEERDQDFDFNEKTVLSSWSEVYVHPHILINSLLDLEQKRVAVLGGSIQEQDLAKRAKAFGLRLTLVETPSFQNVLEQVSRGTVDAGVVNVYYARWNAYKYKVLPTHLVFNPAQLHFAVPKGDPQRLIPPLDRQVSVLMQTPRSPYYQAVDRWLSGTNAFRFPFRYLWLPLSLSVATIVVLGLVVWNWSLKKEIQRRRAVEAQLSASEQRYSSLIAALPVGIFRNNIQGENIYLNERSCEMLGMTPKQGAGTGWVAAMHPDDRERMWTGWTKALAENRPFQQEYRFLKPDGQVVWVYGQAVPEWDSQGEICGYVGSVTDITDRKRAEESLRKQEERLRLAMQSAGMICWEYNTKTREVNYWGRYTADGWQAEFWQATLDDFYQDIHPDDRAQAQFAYALALNNSSNLNIEYRLLLPEREALWLLSLGQVQKKAQGIVMVGVSLDITKQKNTEAKLRASEQRFRRAVENAPFPIMIHAEDGEILQINGVWTSLTGYTAADIPTTAHWTRLAYGDRAQEALENTAESYRLESRIDKGDWRIRTREGEERIWHFHVAPLGLLPDGRRFVISMAIDMTHRRAAEKALQERETFLREMTNNIPGTMIQYVLRPDGSDRVEYIGPGCVDLWELQPEQIEQDSSLLWKPIHPEDAPPLYASILESAQNLTPWLWEWRITTAITDTEKWVQGRGNPKRLENGDVMWTSVVLDITDRKQTEQALLQAKEEAEQASYYKTSFLATMSHEIRTPMNGVLGMLSLLKNTNLTDIQRSRLEMAEFSAESLLGLINDILDFSKIEAGKMELEQVEFDLIQELEAIVQTMAPMAYDKGLEFIFDVRQFPPSTVLGDPRRLRQILTNLVSNAIKFTVEGFVLLRCDFHPGPSENDRLQVTIAVEDTGVGIPADKLDSLFDAFTQADVSTTRKYGGSGLGLAIVKQLSVLMGGAVHVCSEVDRGSCFECVVSLGIAATPLPVLSDQSLQDLTLLLIEDNDRLFQALASPLRQWGATVIALESTLDSNLEAVLESVPSIPENDRVRGREIDLVIIDEHFVELEGLEWVQSLSRKPQVEAIPVVIMTTVSDQLSEGWDPNGRSSGQRDLGHDSGKGNLAPTGNYGYLLKPITPNQLIKVLSQLSQTRFLAVFNEDEDLQGESSEPIWSTSTQLLVVEDSDINQAVIQGFLEILGLQIDCAASGQEALQILQRRTQEPYPLILMDCQMPEMDGYETTRQIRQGRAGEGYRQVPIIALTAHAMPDDREKCLAAGMNDYLPKPLTLRELKTTLKQWLTDHPSEDNSDHPPPSPSNFPASIPLFDAEGLLDRTEGHRDLAEMMCQRFLEGIPPTLQELKTIVYAGDLRSAENPIATFNIEAIERYAHRLKGSASLIGAEAFRYQAAQLEAQAKQTDRRSSLYPPEILDMIEILCLLFDQTQTEIDRWLLNL